MLYPVVMLVGQNLIEVVVVRSREITEQLQLLPGKGGEIFSDSPPVRGAVSLYPDMKGNSLHLIRLFLQRGAGDQRTVYQLVIVLRQKRVSPCFR